MKKFLAALLAVLMILSSVAVIAYAEEEPPVEEGPTPASYEICQDADFLKVHYLAEGNDKATILKPGDKLKTYPTRSKNGVTVTYYPDADAMYSGSWVPADANNLAFSPTAVAFKKDDSAKAAGTEATIQDIDFTDFTIAYSDENTFVGWVIESFDPSQNEVKVCGVWEKNHKIAVSEREEDFYYIINFFYSLRKAIAAPFFTAGKWIANALLYVQTWFYNLMFGAKA